MNEIAKLKDLKSLTPAFGLQIRKSEIIYIQSIMCLYLLILNAFRCLFLKKTKYLCCKYLTFRTLIYFQLFSINNLDLIKQLLYIRFTIKQTSINYEKSEIIKNIILAFSPNNFLIFISID